MSTSGPGRGDRRAVGGRPALRAPLSAVVALGVALLAGTAPVTGQETITSDRPGIGSGSAVLEAGILQAEFGAAFLGADGVDALSVGQLFVRYGFGGFELEFLGNSWVSYRFDDPGFGDPAVEPDRDGFEDVGLGMKVPVARGLGGRADLSLQGTVTLPTGSDAIGSDEWVPAVAALADVAVGASTAVGLNTGYRVGVGAVDATLFASVTPSMALTAELGAYAGWAGSYSDGEDTNWIEGGLTLLANPDVQLDLNGATSPDTDQWFLGAGVAIRTGTR